MVLGVDIGNTNVSFGLMDKNGKISRKCAIPTASSNLKLFSAGVKKRVKKIIISSVVPSALARLKHRLKKNFKGAEIFVVGKNVKVPLKCAYARREIGQDRLVTAFAAGSFYGLPILIIDFGTAVTFDAVSKKGVYLGGLILPGIKMSLESLSERTAMLPKTYLKKTSSFIGRDTASSIRNGMIYGYGAICEGLISSFRKKVDKNIKVIATGGDAPLISRYAPSMRRIDLHLSLKGLYLLSETV